MDKQVVGFINSALTNKVDLADEAFKDMIAHEADGRNAVILSVVVHKEFQGRGLVGSLLKQFILRTKQTEIYRWYFYFEITCCYHKSFG